MKHQIIATPDEVLEKIRPAFESIGELYEWDLRRNGVDGSYLNHIVHGKWQRFEDAIDAIALERGK